MRYIQRQWDINKGNNEIYTKIIMRYNKDNNEIYTKTIMRYIQRDIYKSNEIYTKTMRYIQRQWDIYKGNEI